MEGGMGNKFGCIFHAYQLAKETGKELVISSVRNMHGNVGFHHLFSKENNISEYENTVTELDTIVPKNIPFLLHKSHFVNCGAINSDREVTYHRGMSHEQLVNHIKTLNSCCYLVDGYHAMQHPNMMTDVVNELKIHEDVLSKVIEICSEYQIDKTVKGIHIRATDWPYKQETIDNAYSTIQRLVEENPLQKIFVCCDEQSIEKDLCEQLPDNIIVFDKSSYVKKAVEGTWREDVADVDGRVCNYNTLRDEQSVIEAFIDMLILSRTTIEYGHPISSFWYFAKIYSNLSSLN
jgi:hypothetical protein